MCLPSVSPQGNLFLKLFILKQFIDSQEVSNIAQSGPGSRVPLTWFPLMVLRDRITLEADIGTVCHSVINADLCNLHSRGDLHPLKIMMYLFTIVALKLQ